MAQEGMSDWYEYARELASQQKALSVERWYVVEIHRKVREGESQLLWRYDLPEEVYERCSWVIRWRMSRLVCQYPRDNVREYVIPYYKKEKCPFGNEMQRFLSARTKVAIQRRKIREYVDYQRANNLFFDEEADERLHTIRQRLAVREEEVQTAEERLKRKIEEFRNEKG